ncbi:Uncharacterized protein TCM_001851 [Theobroma cacao]|uniref:Uncharacterized protein n=1 Tax=Theobroma cacao TaxID=3641 RepID=A0A061DK20_THECC|nr:Uncharacterized protein TCM_001851 [Theobroma cacao]
MIEGFHPCSKAPPLQKKTPQGNSFIRCGERLRGLVLDLLVFAWGWISTVGHFILHTRNALCQTQFESCFP